MGRNKKPFIDKKNAATYHVVRRSMRDVGGHVVGGDDHHAAAHLVHRRRLERVALAVHVPRDEVARAAALVAGVGAALDGVARGRALVVGDVLGGRAVPAVEHVPGRADGVAAHAVDDREDLALDADTVGFVT